jgi:CubicO group peptidase (beta-lactamase class C family)
VELGVPITPATVFDIGSVSKQFTALAVLLLAKDGKLSLDDEIQRFVPEVPRYARPVTLRHLLHHTSGLRDYIDILGWSGIGDESVTTDADALAAITRQQRLNFEPGAEYLYSNSGFFLLSVVVRRASGRSLRDFAAERIFGPLGMRHTQFLDRHELIVPGKAGSYAGRGGSQFALALANWEQTGDGAVNTSVEDLLLWERNFSEGRVGGADLLRELTTPGRLNDGSPMTYALGIGVDTYRGLPRVSHGGSWAGFRAQLTRFPAAGVSIITLCNLSDSNPGALTRQVGDLLLGDRLGPAPAPVSRPDTARRWTPPAALLAELAGTYHSEELFADWVLSVRGDSLFARPGLGPEILLVPSGPDGFTAYGTRIAVRREAGRVAGLTLNNRGLRDFRLDRTGFPR